MCWILSVPANLYEIKLFGRKYEINENAMCGIIVTFN
jgi:hypothetical protein